MENPLDCDVIKLQVEFGTSFSENFRLKKEIGGNVGTARLRAQPAEHSFPTQAPHKPLGSVVVGIGPHSIQGPMSMTAGTRGGSWLQSLRRRFSSNPRGRSGPSRPLCRGLSPHRASGDRTSLRAQCQVKLRTRSDRQLQLLIGLGLAVWSLYAAMSRGRGRPSDARD